MRAADLDGDGTLNYEEFICATANLAKLEKEANILAAFKQARALCMPCTLSVHRTSASLTYDGGERDNMHTSGKGVPLRTPLRVGPTHVIFVRVRDTHDDTASLFTHAV